GLDKKISNSKSILIELSRLFSIRHLIRPQAKLIGSNQSRSLFCLSTTKDRTQREIDLKPGILPLIKNQDWEVIDCLLGKNDNIFFISTLHKYKICKKK
ncbi:hypothetical protein BY996DRAFT_4573896, partial [Phakopsora pachyrhizi]